MAAFTKKKSGKEELMSSTETVSLKLIDRLIDDSFGLTLVKNLSFGVNLYENALSKDDCLRSIETLDSELAEGSSFSWENNNYPITTESTQSMRNAVDFEMSPENLGKNGEKNKKLYEIDRLLFKAIKRCIDDYCRLWDIEINYYEPLNFVKYSYPNSYFKLHIDHSPINARTVSAVAYLNDDYKGGELRFPRLDGLTIKPKAGDIVVFPSTYMYKHESKEILSGTKYSVAAMTDYSERV